MWHVDYLLQKADALVTLTEPAAPVPAAEPTGLDRLDLGQAQAPAPVAEAEGINLSGGITLEGFDAVWTAAVS